MEEGKYVQTKEEEQKREGGQVYTRAGRMEEEHRERKERLTEGGSCVELVISSGGHLEIPVVQLGEVTFDPHSLLWCMSTAAIL